MGKLRSKGTIVVLIAAAIGAFAMSQPAAATGPQADAGASVVNGKPANIQDWPWQVGLAYSRKLLPRPYIRQRIGCGGAILAPRLVITAAHCVYGLPKKFVGQLRIVSGRTRLDARAGQVVPVKSVHLAFKRSGKPRFNPIYLRWDVALLRLARPLAAAPIKLAGPGEAETWAKGRRAWATGWGITRANARKASFHLRVANQVVMGNGLCRRHHGTDFWAPSMLCLGAPRGHASSCNGDSGGPLVVKTSDGHRLVGLTSWGDFFCRGTKPSVYTRVASNPLRKWIASKSKRLVGAEVVGSGAESGPLPTWCQVPKLRGLTVSRAKTRIKSAGCQTGHVLAGRRHDVGRGRVSAASRLRGWLASPGTSIHLWVNR